ncbi:hypothetical protein [Vreelandella sp. EE27]
MVESTLFRSLVLASFLSNIALYYFGWQMAFYMPEQHVELLGWQGYSSIFNEAGLRDLEVIIIVTELAGLAGLLFKPLVFRNVLLFSMILWVVEGIVGGYYVATPLINMLDSIQRILVSLALGYAFFSKDITK